MDTEGLKSIIITHVQERFLVEGFSRLSVDRIASDLGISKKTFYKVFENKEELVRQVADSFMQEVRDQIFRILLSDQGFLPKLNELMMFLGRQIARFHRVIEVDIRKHVPELWTRLHQFRSERIHEVFGKLLDQGIREGHVRAGVNKRIFILAYLSAVEKIVQPELLADESFSAHEALQNILVIFFHGILTEEATAKLEQLQHT
jgi:AcrR family transcriptional regulator